MSIKNVKIRFNLDKETPSSSCIFTQPGDEDDKIFGNELYVEEVDQRLYAVAGR